MVTPTEASAAAVHGADWTPQERSAIEQMRQQYAKSGGSMSPQQESAMVQQMRSVQAQLLGTAAAMQSMPGLMGGMAASPYGGYAQPQMQPQIQPQIQPQSITEAALLAELQRIEATGGPYLIRRIKEGFSVNEQPFLDPEGAIQLYSANVLSGAITYVVRAPGGYIVKSTRAGAMSAGVPIAYGQKTQGGWDITTRTGQRLTGDGLTTLSKGFIVMRAGTAFRYTPGEGARTIAAPKGWNIADLQRGDVDGTGFILVERDTSPQSTNKGAELLTSFKTLGSAFGIGEQNDYALLNISTGGLLPINLNVLGKEVTVMSGCKKQNAFVNKCSDSKSFESLFKPNDGGRNLTHYFWRVDWFNTAKGPIAVTQPTGGRNIRATDLQSGKSVLLLERTLGVGEWDAVQQPTGEVRVEARLGLSQEAVPDVLMALEAGSDLATPAEAK